MSEIQLAGACAIWILRNALSEDEELRSTVIACWLPVLPFNFDDNPQPHRELFDLGCSLAPVETRQELFLQATLDAQKHRHPFAFRLAKDRWNHQLTSDVIQLSE